MPKIAVMTDSSADINTQQAEQMNLAVMRFPLMIDGQEYIEETEIKTPEFPVHPKASRKPNHVSSADRRENDKLFRPLGIGYQPQS